MGQDQELHRPRLFGGSAFSDLRVVGTFGLCRTRFHLLLGSREIRLVQQRALGQVGPEFTPDVGLCRSPLPADTERRLDRIQTREQTAEEGLAASAKAPATTTQATA